MSETVVVNLRRVGNPPDAVRIDRTGPFGNPYRIGTHGDRAEVIRLFRAHFEKQLRVRPAFRRQVAALRGKTLVCHCKPLACHGDVIKEYLDRLPPAGTAVPRRPVPPSPDAATALEA